VFECFLSAARTIYYCRKFVNQRKMWKTALAMCKKEVKVRLRMFLVILLNLNDGTNR
jgi:hypothetical protein